MKNTKRSPATKILIAAGSLLLISAMTMLVCWQWGISASQKKAQSYLESIRALIPEPQGAVLEEKLDNEMPALSLDGKDFIGIIEMPSHNLSLPVCAEWGNESKYPCKFSGSIYDKSLQIGATSQKGQYDFYREISVGDAVLYTDMSGKRYSFTVTDLKYRKHADQSALTEKPSDLTLFIKNIYDFEYLIVFCTVSNS